MKVNGKRDSVHYWPRAFATCPTFKLNGEAIGMVIEADDVEGYVVVYQEDDRGRLKLNADGTAFAKFRLSGRVEISGERRRAA